MIGNIKRTFPLKTGLQEKQVLQDPGYVEGVQKLHAACCMVCCKVVQNILCQKELKENKK